MNEKLDKRISRWLIIGAMLVAAPRYVGVNAHAEGWLIGGDVWRWVVALSGLGMAVLEGVAVWYCWQRWGDAQPGPKRNVLMALIATMLVTLALMVAPYTYAASEVALVTASVSPGLHAIWSIAVSIAPLVVMAASGLAEKTLPVEAQQAQGEAGDVQQVVAAMLNNYEAKIGNLLSGFASVADVQQAFDRVDSRLRKLQHAEQPAQPDVAHVAQHEPIEVADVAQPAQLASGLTWSVDNLRNVIEQHPDISATDARNLFADPPTRQAVASAIARLKGGK